MGSEPGGEDDASDDGDAGDDEDDASDDELEEVPDAEVVGEPASLGNHRCHP